MSGRACWGTAVVAACLVSACGVDSQLDESSSGTASPASTQDLQRTSTPAATQDPPPTAAPIELQPQFGSRASNNLLFVNSSAYQLIDEEAFFEIEFDVEVSDDLPALPTNSTGWRDSPTAFVDAERVTEVARALGVTVEPQHRDGYWYSYDSSTGIEFEVDERSPVRFFLSGPFIDAPGVPWGEIGDTGEFCDLTAEPIPGASRADCPGDIVVTVDEVALPSVEVAEDRVLEAMETIMSGGAEIRLETEVREFSVVVTVKWASAATQSPVNWTFAFAANGELTSAQGAVDAPVPAGDYPLIGLPEAVDRLSDPLFRWLGPIDPPIRPGTGVVPSEPAIQSITLVDVAADFWYTYDDSGHHVFVPAYSFTDDTGLRYLVPAVPDAYLRTEVQGSTSPPGTGPGPATEPGDSPPTSIVVPATTTTSPDLIDVEPSTTPPRTVGDSVPPEAELPTTPVADINRLPDGVWIVPAELPNGYIPIYAVDEVRLHSLTYRNEVGNEIRIWTDQQPFVHGDPVDVAGVQWFLQTLPDATTVVFQREFSGSMISVDMVGLDVSAGSQVVASLLAGSESLLPIEPLRPSPDFRDHDLLAADPDEPRSTVRGFGINGWYCLESSGPLTATGGCGAGRAGQLSSELLVVGTGVPHGDGSITLTLSSIVAPDVAGVEAVFGDGTISTAITEDRSGKYEDRFWIVTSNLAGADPFQSPAVGVEVRLLDADGLLLGLAQLPEYLR